SLKSCTNELPCSNTRSSNYPPAHSPSPHPAQHSSPITQHLPPEHWNSYLSTSPSAQIPTEQANSSPNALSATWVNYLPTTETSSPNRHSNAATRQSRLSTTSYGPRPPTLYSNANPEDRLIAPE